MSELEKKYKEFEERSRAAEQGGGAERIEKQHSGGKKTARERLVDLLDPGTFVEIDKFVVHRSTNFGIDKTYLMELLPVMVKLMDV